MVADLGPLYEAARAKKVVNISYTKEKDGMVVDHAIGIYEIRSEEGKMWGWDVNENSHIRVFILNNLNSFQVLDQDFVADQWPVKIDGEEII